MRKSPVEFGLVAVELNGLKPHFLFKEDMEEGHIKDYIQASSSIYPAVQPCTIDGVEYIDGGYADVLPINMAIERGATQIIAVKLNAVGKLKHEPLQNTQNLTVIESKWDLGNTLVFDTQNARRIMRLGYLDTMRTYNVFDGYYYTFAKGAFGRIDLKLADTSAKLFELDPTLIYTKAMLLRKLSSSVNEFTEKMDEAIHTIKSTTLNRSSIVNLVKGIKDVTDSKILCLVIASNIKEKGDSSIFLNKSISKLLSEQITAAKFLVKYGIIE
jgi:NTE family protein